jgi:hypothetical protein
MYLKHILFGSNDCVVNNVLQIIEKQENKIN